MYIAFPSQSELSASSRLGKGMGMKRNVIVVEQDPELRNMFKSAFLFSGYQALVTENIHDVAGLIQSHICEDGFFDLVIVDISDKEHLRLIGKLQNDNMSVPFFTLKDAKDKSLLIELLNKKRTQFIEQYIELHLKGQRLFCGARGEEGLKF